MQSLQAGGSLKQLVALVGGSTSGFTNIIAAYVTTFTVTIAVSVICLGLAIAMYAVRTDQKLRRDLRYGGARPCMPDVARANFFLLCTWAALHALQQLYWPVHTTCLRHLLQGHHSLRSVWALLWPCRPHTPIKRSAVTCGAEVFLPRVKFIYRLRRLLLSPALTPLLQGLTLAAACADSERSLGVYKVYYWLTATLFVLMFVMAAWFVVLVAVNTTGADPSPS